MLRPFDSKVPKREPFKSERIVSMKEPLNSELHDSTHCVLRIRNGRTKAFLLVIIALFFLGCTSHTGFGKKSKQPLPEGSKLPRVQLSPPMTDSERRYLGLADEKVFDMGQISTDVVLIEILNMYCPYCQKAAPRVNELYQLISEDPDLKDRIKIIGIGATNSQYEVDTFKKKYEVPFPIFPDQERIIYKKLKATRTPFFIAAKKKDNKRYVVIHTKSGGLDSAKNFLVLLTEKAGFRSKN
ncbi:peroxiredoxin family protein [Thermodesulfobacteriota bacterium]